MAQFGVAETAIPRALIMSGFDLPRITSSGLDSTVAQPHFHRGTPETESRAPVTPLTIPHNRSECLIPSILVSGIGLLRIVRSTAVQTS